MKYCDMTCQSNMRVIEDDGELMPVIKDLAQEREDAFYVADLSDVVRKHKKWMALLPNITPHYAVKCNDDAAVLKVIAGLGNGFDCASKIEMQTVLDLGVDPSRIVYANPCKQKSYIKYAAQKGVSMMTFDNETELHKIKAFYPDAKLIIRILPPDDTKSQCQLGMKFGCHPKDTFHLLEVARDLDLNVIGVSFHVGSGCYDPTAFSAAVKMAHDVFVQGRQLGYCFDLLDIGGGFPGQVTAAITMEQICDELCPALDHYFPPSSGVRIIAEPGRFFVASAFTLVTNVIAKRVVARDIKIGNKTDGIENSVAPTASEEPAYMYYVNDGVYGSFNCLLYDHAEVFPSLIYEKKNHANFTSSIWGPTCDGLDCIKTECLLPELDLGEWIVFADMGAYTMCAGSMFNGMPQPSCHYVVRQSEQMYLCGTKNNNKSNISKVPLPKAGHQPTEEHMTLSCDLAVVPDL